MIVSRSDLIKAVRDLQMSFDPNDNLTASALQQMYTLKVFDDEDQKEEAKP